jgi:hypothetical protein
MLTKRDIFLIVAIIVFIFISRKLYYTEHYETNVVTDITTMRELINKGTINMVFQTLNIELVEPTEIIGRLFLDYYVGTIHIHLGAIELIFGKNSTKILHKGKKLHELNFKLNTKTLYNFKILLYPVEQFIAIIINDNLLFSEFIDLDIDNVQFIVKDVANGQRTFFQAKKLDYKFLGNDVELGKLHVNNRYLDASSGVPALVNGDSQPGSIWSIERHGGKYYSIKSIKNNLYLGFKPFLYLSNIHDNGTKLIILCRKTDCIIFNKTSYVLNIEAGKMNTIFNSVLKIDKVNNVENWITYGSTFNLVNNTKEFLSGNPNLKYDFPGSSGLSAVYSDTVADNQLINWTIEDHSNKYIGHLVKPGNGVYLKNNGYYLQVIRGNPTPSRNGVEVSLGSEKDDNSKWIIKHIGNSRGLYKKDDAIHLYHSKTGTYLYNIGKKFTISGHTKNEVVSLDKTDRNSVWTIGNSIILENKSSEKNTISYYRYKKHEDYLTSKERLWKKMIDFENKKIKEQLSKYNRLKGVEEDIEKSIKQIQGDITNLEKTKCPNKKVCPKVSSGSCIEDKTSKPYSIIRRKDTVNNGMSNSSNPNWIDTDNVGRCKSLADFDIETSPYVKNKEYIKKIPMAMDNMSVSSN